MRVKTQQLLAAKAFIKSNKREEIIEITPNKTSIQTCLDRGLPTEVIKLRLVRVDLPNEVEVLITNLMDTTVYEVDLFKELYHLRWGIEENYKRLKQWVVVRTFQVNLPCQFNKIFMPKLLPQI